MLVLLTSMLAACDSGDFDKSPSSSEVSKITAELFRSGITGEKIEKFTVHKAFYEAILALLDGAHEATDSMKWPGLGEFDITLATRIEHVKIFYTHEEVGAFKLNGIYYRASSDIKFVRMIEAAKKQNEVGASDGDNAPK